MGRKKYEASLKRVVSSESYKIDPELIMILYRLGKWVREGKIEPFELTEEELLELSTIKEKHTRGIGNKKLSTAMNQQTKRRKKELSIAEEKLAECIDNAEKELLSIVRKKYEQTNKKTERGCLLYTSPSPRDS